MTVLVMHHRGTLTGTPYLDWLADYDGDVLLVASREHLALVSEELPEEGGAFRRTAAVDGYETSGELEARVLEFAREHGVSHIIACQELDLERAAGLREVLGLPGQRMDTVLPYRDKSEMKRLVTAAGLAVAPYRDVECATELIGFAEQHGFPVVLKPRDSAGSVGLRILDSRAELDAYLADEFDLYGPDQPNLIVEAFVHGSMCHVDGLVVDGRVALAWPSQYQYTLASFATDTGPRIDLTLDLDDPLAHRLLEFTERTIEALSGPADFAFHLEAFHTPDDEIVLCEIACRTGGAAIRDIVRTMFGIDPSESWVRAQLGLPLPEWIGAEKVLPRQMSGQLVLMKRPGRVVSIPQEPPPFPWIEKYQVFVQPGHTMKAAKFSADFLLMALVSGRDRAECEARLRKLEEWFLAGLVLEPVAD
ncbi:ATP-grasp domain-containing protein [Kitasatospora sp. McL0602]|uniref:ATP-grasp domain-containing protein n=1 Tax=Kitasatospora sp. McL0602 TaxID=3439530 RepID=UPI003F88CCB2